ncbi:MAG: TerC/Alx family metal homeostasis membrane protein [Bacteroidota bacterium]|nr:TerC/Alx family metal homeostasis membrane protein [Bacteroidota bacterium]
MVSNEFLFFAVFILFVVGILLLDLGVFSKESKTVTFKVAALWSAIWVLFALSFYTFLNFYGHIIHGIYDMDKLQEVTTKYLQHVTLIPDNFEASVDNYRRVQSLEFITGYLVEYALSVDNIFVMMLIFSSFNVREKFYKKVLFWGIMGAIVMRFGFIFSGSALINKFEWILYLFGGLLIFSGGKIFFQKEEDESIDTDKHPIVKFCTRYFPVFPKYVSDRFLVRKKGVLMITPLFVVLLIVEFTDLIFAIDSVPAVFAVTKDPYIVFFSNIFAILGLRSMFFFLANILPLFHYLKTGLGFLLVFIGVKMLVPHDVLHEIGFQTSHSLIVIIVILGSSIAASLLFPPKEKKHAVIKTDL